ncbi:MAG: AAA family ATPase [Deltaproteobacteria bacterium]|nr:AAA family ATPase [Deltaproteobacteria bacterium]
MRVVAIRGCDLASLQGSFALELDRPPLSGLGLFAIHGPVGAGKSTLLDALCLGLFGRTPRLNGVGGAPVGDDDDDLKSNDPRTLVRRGALLSFAEVDFSGVDGRLYRARWEVKRGKRRDGRARLQTERQSLVDVMSGLRLGDTNTEVRTLVRQRLGLSFDELCRSVLLAQGGFQGFLQAKPAERGALLEKVTGTAIYSRLSIGAHERAKRLREGEAALEQARAALQILDDDGRRSAEAAAVAASVAACAAEDASAHLVTEVEAARLRGALVRSVDEAQRAVHKAKANAAAAVERRRRAGDALAAAVAAEEALRPAIENAQKLDVRLEALSTSTAEALHESAAADHARAQEQLVAIERKLADTQQKKSSARSEMNDDVAAFVDVVDAIVSGLDRLERARLEVEGATAICRAQAQAQDDADVDVAERLRLFQALKPERPAVLAGCDLDAVLAGLLFGVVDVEEAAQARFSHELLVARQVRERLLRALSKTQERALLEDGEPCAVCGSTQHPWRDGAAPDLHPIVDEETQRIATLELEQRSSVARLADARARLQGLPAPENLVVDVDIAMVETLRAQERQALQARRSLDDAVARRDELARDHAFQREALAAKQAAVVDVEAGLLGLHLLEGDLVDPRKRKKTLLADVKRYAKARELHAAAVTDEARLQQEHAGAQARSEAAASSSAAALAALNDLRSRREGLVAERAAALQGDVVVVEAGLVRSRVDAAAGDADAQEALARAQSSSSTALAVLTERLGGLSAGPVADVAALEVEASAARSAAVVARERHALLRAGLQHDATLAARARVVDADLAAHRASSQIWWELADVIGSADGARFRQFAQGLTLDALVVHANEHLKILAPRYRLQRVAVTAAKHDLELVVVDIESGDEVRSTSTLSGGESFLVSLALALGLSSLSANEGARGRVESLFIDEGFSALDAETLDTALAAFDALRQTGRQIGVISHVPLLVERIGAQVRVVPVGGGASRVEIHAG